LVSSWTFSWIIIFSIPSMAYRVLLIVPTYLPNWLLVLPPKNRLNTCSVSIQAFRSISNDLIWSSRFKIMVNSNLNLHQRRFMIPAAVHTTSCGSYLVCLGSKSSHSFAELHKVMTILGKNLIPTYFIPLSTLLTFLNSSP
jgi:hypothetical protein